MKLERSLDLFWLNAPCFRYGGLTVGVTLPYVPDSYTSDSKTRDILRMVAVKENAHVSNMHLYKVTS